MTALDLISVVTATVEPLPSDAITVQRLRSIADLVLEKVTAAEKPVNGYHVETQHVFRSHSCPLITVIFEVRLNIPNVDHVIYIQIGPAAFAHFNICNPASKNDILKIRNTLSTLSDAALEARNDTHKQFQEQSWEQTTSAFLTFLLAHLKSTGRIHKMLLPNRYALFENYRLSPKELQWWNAQ